MSEHERGQPVRFIWRFDGRQLARSPWRDRPGLRPPPDIDPHEVARRLRAEAARIRGRLLFPDLARAAELDRDAERLEAFRVFPPCPDYSIGRPRPGGSFDG